MVSVVWLLWCGLFGVVFFHFREILVWLLWCGFVGVVAFVVFSNVVFFVCFHLVFVSGFLWGRVGVVCSVVSLVRFHVSRREVLVGFLWCVCGVCCGFLSLVRWWCGFCGVVALVWFLWCGVLSFP